MRLPLITTLVFVGMTAFATAQKTMDPFDYQVSNVALLQAQPVKTELKVTEAQRAAMNKIASSFNNQINALYEQARKSKDGKPPKDADPKLKAAYEKLKKGVLAQLSAVQLKRLREITLQQAGLPALTDQIVATRVGIPPAQLKQLQGIYAQAVGAAAKVEDAALNAALKDLKAKKPKSEKEAKEIMDEANKRAEATQKKIAPQIDKLKKGAEAKVIASLTPAQKIAWQNLKGKPFKA